MIPATWTPHLRATDGEHVGYLVPVDDLVVPTSLLGHPLGAPMTAPEARAALDGAGLAAIDRRWWAFLPYTLEGRTVPLDGHEAVPDAEWRSVHVVEITPTETRLRLEAGEPAEMRVRILAPTPVGDLVRAEPPE
jgi:hypothetical protein